MAAIKVSAVAKFVSHKVRKVCWEPTRPDQLQPPSLLASGSWDDEDNNISLWFVSSQSIDDDYNGQMYANGEPELLCSLPYRGNVTDLIFLSNDLVLSSSSRGSATIFKFDSGKQSLSVGHQWSDLHAHPTTVSECSCTAVATQDDEFVSVGEDGRINVVSLNHLTSLAKETHCIGPADSCSLNDVCYIQQRCIAVVNSIGQFKVWDLRDQTSQKPSKSLVLSGNRISLQCIAQHPTQPQLVATGGQDGALYMWDMRNDKLPVSLLRAHSSDMWDVQFHPSHPNHLFTCSNDGALWHWDNSDTTTAGVQAAASLGLFGKVQANDSNTAGDWMKTSQRHLEITDLLDGQYSMSVNSLHATDNRLVCGTDSEQLIIIRNLAVF